jgi:hypothetical protein
MGDGESSIISTHPDESLAELGPFFLSLELSEERLSILALLSLLFRDFTTSCMDLGVPMPLGRAAELPKRSLGTRVWIFCSRFFTRARISDTICTPLLRDVVVVGAGITGE